MTTGGWIIMLLSVGGVTALFLICLYKVLTNAPGDNEHVHGLNIETGDTSDD